MKLAIQYAFTDVAIAQCRVTQLDLDNQGID